MVNFLYLFQTKIEQKSVVFSFTDITLIFFISFILILGILILFSKDVIYCLLSLIMLYVISAFILLSFNLQFLAFSLVAVSLGAVAVLFLYVVLMVNLKGSRIRDSLYHKFNISCFVLCTFFIGTVLFRLKFPVETNYSWKHLNGECGLEVVEDDVLSPFFIDWLSRSLGNDNPLKLYGLIIYDYYYMYFVLIGVLLLAALIGCLLLAFDYDSSKGESPINMKKRISRIKRFSKD